jgi:hypothetical protein
MLQKSNFAGSQATGFITPQLFVLYNNKGFKPKELGDKCAVSKINSMFSSEIIW